LSAVKTDAHRLGQRLKGSLFKHSEILVTPLAKGDSRFQSPR
jgi:hypothetical protein